MERGAFSHRLLSVCICLVFLLLFNEVFTPPAGAEPSGGLLVSANDQRFKLEDGANKVRSDHKPGAITILDFEKFPPEVSHVKNVPCSVIGPPTCVAVTSGQSMILVSSSMKVDPDNPDQQIPDNRFSVVTFQDGKPQLSRQIRVGNQPSGVSISPNDKFAVVANRADGTVSLLSMRSDAVRIIDTLKVAGAEDSVSDVEFMPDGKRILVSISGQGSLAVLHLSDNELKDSGERLKVGDVPYEVDVSPDGKLALVANVGPHDNTIAVIDMTGEKPEVVDKIYTAPSPEGVTFSPDGQHVVVSCLQHTHAKVDDPKRQEQGQVVFMKRDGNILGIVERVWVDPIPQAAIFSPDGKYVVVGSFENSSLSFYRVRGNGLEKMDFSIDVPGHPAAMRIAD